MTEVSRSKRGRRTMRDIRVFVPPGEILKLILQGDPWPYRRDPESYLCRDQALISFIYMMGCRINEALKVFKTQFDWEETPGHITVKDFRISKRTERILRREGIPRIDLGLPLDGLFSPFTDLILKWYDLSPGPKLFPNLGTRRAWEIVDHHTGKWPHYFRSQRISWMVNKVRSPLIVAEILGVKSPQTLAHYYKTSWKEHIEDLKGE